MTEDSDARHKALTNGFVAMLITYLTVRESDGGVDAIPEPYRSFRTTRMTTAAFVAGFRVSSWLVDYVARETGTPRSEVLQRMALDFTTEQEEGP